MVLPHVIVSPKRLKSGVMGCGYLSVVAGAIPESLGQLRSLQTMNFKFNRVSGGCRCALAILESASFTGRAVRGAGAHLGFIGLNIVQKALQSK